MPQKRFYQIIKDLSFEKKLIAAGALLLAVSLFLPWYQDLDTFRTGDTFTGITGPMYLAGLTFLIISSSTLLLLVAQQVGIRFPTAYLRSPKIYLHYGIFSFYLLLLINSIYFHRNFGVNITLKQSGFGMFIAFIAAASLTIGGYLNTRERKEIMKSFEEEIQEPMLAPSMQQKPKENLRTITADQAKTSGSAVRGSMVHGADLKKNTDNTPAQPYRMDL